MTTTLRFAADNYCHWRRLWCSTDVAAGGDGGPGEGVHVLVDVRVDGVSEMRDVENVCDV